MAEASTTKRTVSKVFRIFNMDAFLWMEPSIATAVPAGENPGLNRSTRGCSARKRGEAKARVRIGDGTFTSRARDSNRFSFD
jgi:hypothetical protein